MPSSCIFEFDRPDPVYYSGETINGRIRLSTTSDKSCREVYISFEGEAKVRWEERKSRQQNGKTHHYTEYYRGNETYLNTRTNVFPEGTLPAGEHVFTFCIPLPIQCPTSCVEAHGQISYELSLVINRPFRFDNVFKQPLTVIRQLDLNLQPELLVPLDSEDIKYFCCWPCSSGPVISTLHIPFGGYAPGQQIKYSLEIDNQSHGYDLEGITFKLIQSIKFTATSPHHKTRTVEKTLTKDRQEERCLRLSKRLLEGTLIIPSVPPTSEEGIIKMLYYITMYIKTGDCHTDSEITIPIVMGTVPLAQSATNPIHAQEVLPTAPSIEPQTPGDRPPSYDFYKPPSFEEAMQDGDRFVDTDVDERNRIEGFIPKYPMYTNFATPTAPPQDNIDGFNAPLLHNAAAPAPPYTFDAGRIPPMPPTGTNEGIGWRT